MPTLKLQRTREFANFLRAYHLVLDGKRVAKIRSGKELELDISAGFHTLQLELDWCSSKPIEFELGHGEQLELACGATDTGLGIFGAVGRMLTDSDNFLWLAPTTQPPPDPTAP